MINQPCPNQTCLQCLHRVPPSSPHTHSTGHLVHIPSTTSFDPRRPFPLLVYSFIPTKAIKASTFLYIPPST